MSRAKSNSLVEHPAHYNQHPSGVECIDIVEWMTFNIGSALKYLWRSGLKNGNPTLLDLEKASWYINREIERITRAAKLTDGGAKKSVYDDAERAASIFGEDVFAVRGRLFSAVASLKTTERSRFRSTTLNGDWKSILSDDKNFRLEWRLRPQPECPPSDRNPQQPTGVVVLSFVGNPEDAPSDLIEKIIL